MKNLNFDLNRLTSPKTCEDFEAVLDEALNIADDIQAALDRLCQEAASIRTVDNATA